MKLIVFDVSGYVAHFRKYFSTTSSLSYAFPPRTSIVGMIAAILGYERDTYYEQFSSEICNIALSIRTPVRKLIQKLNYLMTDKPLTDEKLRGMSSSPAQIPVELVVCDDVNFSQLRYRIFFNHMDNQLMERLKQLLVHRRFTYPISLGTANNLALVEYLDQCEGVPAEVKNEVPISTVIPTSLVEEIIPKEGVTIYFEENVPVDFSNGRYLKKKETYIYEAHGKPITVRLKDDVPVYRCSVMGEETIGVFM